MFYSIDNSIIYLSVLPLLAYIALCVFARKSGDNIGATSYKFCLAFLIILSIIIALGGVQEGSDKERYIDFYERLNTLDQLSSVKDFGWTVYAYFLKFLGCGTELFFLVTAIIYCFAYLFFAREVIDKPYVPYFIICATGLLGFSGYGVNTVRNGLALSLIFYAIAQKRLSFTLVLFFAASTIHNSVLIIIASWVISKYLIKTNISLSMVLWIGCLILSWLGFSLLDYTDIFAEDDSRIVLFANHYYDEYNTGFRYDFVVYSIVPMFVSYKYIKKLITKEVRFGIEQLNNNDSLYVQLFNTYLLTNAFWLLIIRIVFTNRFAYLSWVIIPVLIIYPYLAQGKIERKQLNEMNIIVMLFMTLNVYLSLNKI